MVEKTQEIYEFGKFQMNLSEHQLLCGGTVIPLTPKAFDTLRVLVENGGRLVSREDFNSLVWAGTYVEENTLAQNVFTVRKALKSFDREGLYIETVPRRGYRFLAEVTRVPKDTQDSAAEDSTLIQTPAVEERPTTSGRAINSLAVLPFVNAGGSQLEHVCDGITDNLINSLSQLPDLRVMSRNLAFRYQADAGTDPTEVGRRLGVRALLLGSVQLSGDNLIVRVELVDAAGGWQLWGQQYSRQLSDPFKVQEEIARDIFGKLRLKLAGFRQRQHTYTHNVGSAKAYHIYLTGRFYLNNRTSKGYRKAVTCFQRAIELDPDFAPAYSGLADAYILQASADHELKPALENMPKARMAIMQALELDDTLAEAHASLGYINFSFDWRMDVAESEFRRALELNPGLGHAHHWYAHQLLASGRPQEALAECKQAIECEPLDPNLSIDLGWHSFYTREYEKAVEHLQRLEELEPDYYPTHILLGRAYACQEKYSEACAQFETAYRLEKSPLSVAFLGYTYALAGETAEARKVLRKLSEARKHGFTSCYCNALVHIGLGEKDEAFEWLEECFLERSEWMMWFGVNPESDSLRQDPRFTNLLRRVGVQT